jgi:hypothetical protein
MTLAGPRDSTIGIVGDGFGSSLVYTTAVYLGFRPERVTVFGPNASPVDTYQQFAFNLGQTTLQRPRRRPGIASRRLTPTLLSFGTVIVTAIALVRYFAMR